MPTKDTLTLMEENAQLKSEVVFLTKQVSNREETIRAFEELSRLGIDEVNYEDKI